MVRNLPIKENLLNTLQPAKIEFKEFKPRTSIKIKTLYFKETEEGSEETHCQIIIVLENIKKALK